MHSGYMLLGIGIICLIIMVPIFFENATHADEINKQSLGGHYDPFSFSNIAVHWFGLVLIGVGIFLLKIFPPIQPDLVVRIIR